MTAWQVTLTVLRVGSGAPASCSPEQGRTGAVATAVGGTRAWGLCRVPSGGDSLQALTPTSLESIATIRLQNFEILKVPSS